jgi:hypothetical protein
LSASVFVGEGAAFEGPYNHALEPTPRRAALAPRRRSVYRDSLGAAQRDRYTDGA